MIWIVLLLLPVWLVLSWLHLRLRGDRVAAADWLILVAPLILAMTSAAILLSVESAHGPIWPHILAALVGYLILAAGFGLGVWLRRR